MIAQGQRQVIKGPVNPYDKATIVSIFPREVVERKFTIQPGLFVVPPGTYDNPSLLHVGPSSWWHELDEDQPLLEIPTSAVMIAESVVKDHCSSLTEVRGDVMPGLFFLPGEITLSVLKKDYAAHLNRAKIKQKEWFSALISLADALWARSNGNPMVVSSDMKLAARELNMEDNKEWCKNQIRAELIRCIACGTMLNSTVVVCPSCKVIVNEGKAKELGLKFAS